MRRKNKKRFWLLRVLLLLIMIVCLIPVGQAYYLSFRHEKQQEKLRNLLDQENIVQQEAEVKEKDIQRRGNVLDKFINLQKENSDLAGWLVLNFYENVKKLSLYDTGITAKFGDTFITLSTCSGNKENGRFVVVAKKSSIIE